MKQHPIDILAYASYGLSFVSGLLTLGFPQAVEAVAPGWGLKVTGVLTIAGIVLAAVLRIKANPTTSTPEALKGPIV